MKKRELAALVNSAKKGNKASYAKLYSHFAHNVYYFALRITKNNHDADDVVQDTMLALYNSLSTLKDPSAVSSFVNTTAYNFSLMLLRKRKDFLSDDDEFFEDNSIEEDKEFIPESYLEEKESREEIIKILDNLPDAQRATLLLHYYEGLSTVEISKVLNLSEEAVRGRLFRGRESIRKAVASDGVKGAVLTSMSLPVLSKILDLEAKAAFDASIQASNWAAVAGKMGFSAHEIATTTKLAALNGSTQLAATGTLAPVAGSISAKTVIATVLTVGIAASGVAFVSQNKIPADANPQQSIVSTDIQSMEYSHNENGEIFDSDGNTAILTEDGSYEIVSHADQEPIVDQPSAENSEADLTDPTTGSSGTIQAQGSGISNTSNSGATLLRGNTLPLKYPIGTDLTLERIIADAEISAPVGIKIVATHLESVDTSKAGEYIVYLQAKNNYELSTALVIIILVD